MATRNVKRPCVCLQCSLSTYLDHNGVKQQGNMQYPTTIKKHKLKDQLLEKKRAVQQEVLADAILIATVGDLPSAHTVSQVASTSVPLRALRFLTYAVYRRTARAYLTPRRQSLASLPVATPTP